MTSALLFTGFTIKSYTIEWEKPENKGGGRTPTPLIFGIFSRTA